MLNAISGTVSLEAGGAGGDISFTDLSGYTIGSVAVSFPAIGEVIGSPVNGVRTSPIGSVTR